MGQNNFDQKHKMSEEILSEASKGARSTVARKQKYSFRAFNMDTLWETQMGF